MSNANTGIPYELFVQRVQQALNDAQGLGAYKNINVQHNVKLVDKNGIERQFDLYWEFEVGGVVYRNVIECKDFANSVPIEKIDALAGKLSSFPGMHGIIATRNAFQSGAIKEAEAKGIDVLIVRQDSAEDWRSADGVPYIKTINIKLVGLVPPQVVQFNPNFDRTWAKENGIAQVSYSCLPKEFQFEEETGKTWTLQDDMDSGLGEPRDGDANIKVLKRNCTQPTFCSAPNAIKVKVLGYELVYRGADAIENEIAVSPEVLGVVEYVSRKRKKVVMKLGEKISIRDEAIGAPNGSEEKGVASRLARLRFSD